MRRDEAVVELRHRYRLRIALDLRHEDRSAVLLGSTMAETPEAVRHACLVADMVPRLLERLAGGPEREEDEP